MAMTSPIFIVGYHIAFAGEIETAIPSDGIFLFTEMAKYRIFALHKGRCSDLFEGYVALLDPCILTARMADIAAISL
jgi:hypothetical protein